MQLIAVVSVTKSTRTNRVLVLTLVNGDVVVIVVAFFIVVVIVAIVVTIVVTIDIIDIVLACRSEWNGRRWIGFLANPGLAPFLPFLPMSFVPPLPLPLLPPPPPLPPPPWPPLTPPRSMHHIQSLDGVVPLKTLLFDEKLKNVGPLILD